MLGNILGSLGGSIGSKIASGLAGGGIGGGILSRIGRFAGNKIGGMIQNHYYHKWFHKQQIFEKFSNLRDSFSFCGAKYGEAIPLAFGKVRVQGKIIWLNKITQGEKTTSTSKYFRGTKQRSQTINKTEFFYNLSFAVAICEGKIDDIGRVWHGDELIDIGIYKHRIYKGGDQQMPDPLIAAIEGEKTPAFRDLAYIVFEEIKLADFNDTIPNFSFEVIRRPNIGNSNTVEDLIESIVMIPGSGEYVYDTVAQTKTIHSYLKEPLSTKTVNVHNAAQIADAVYSLDQLQETCTNVKWVAPVACWFANSDNISDCLIRPAVEFKDDNVSYSEEWRVGQYDRLAAMEVSKGTMNTPNYGGSVNDASIIRYLKELKKRNLNIMFYPMFFIDLDHKPWRGRLTGNSNEVHNFFHKEYGYNEFILHYANLVKKHVNAFVIGSELIGLTRIKSKDGRFPAVDELVSLAQQVKKIVGPDVLVTYAADWSEYHHTKGGWYNLDPLWACDAIDFIGIDAYFPITDTTSSDISDEAIKKGFQSGEGFDYFIDRSNNDNKHETNIAYAWKNLKYWWNNVHINPDGRQTLWRPRSKKIWFTEYGFPSIDKASNQPNIFLDPKSIDGGVPYHSTGEVNFSIQRRCIKAFIEFWQQEEYIENMFLWTWDARPYPAYPHMRIWSDSHLWEKGHWVNNKFGSASVASIILELSVKSNIAIQYVNVSSIDEAIEGMIVNSSQSCMDVIKTLRTSHFFDITTAINNDFLSEEFALEESSISFIKRGNKSSVHIDKDDLIKITENSFTYKYRLHETEILSKLNLEYINSLQEYQENYVHINELPDNQYLSETVTLPLSLSPAEAENIGRFIVQNAQEEILFTEFILPIEYIHLNPSDYIRIKTEKSLYTMRIVSTSLMGLKIKLNAVVDNISSYAALTNLPNVTSQYSFSYSQSKLRIIELPFCLPEESGHNLVAYLNNPVATILYADPYNINEENVYDQQNKIGKIMPSNMIGTVTSLNLESELCFLIIDENSSFTVSGIDSSNLQQSTWYIAKFGNEYIRFNSWELQDNGELLITNLVRGEFGSQHYASSHCLGEEFIILNASYYLISIAEELTGKSVIYDTLSELSCTAIYSGTKNDIPKPYCDFELLNNTQLQINITPIMHTIDSWRAIIPSDYLNQCYVITIKTLFAQQEYYTKDLRYIADISNIDLSLGFEVDIVATKSD